MAFYIPWLVVAVVFVVTVVGVYRCSLVDG